MSELSFVRAVIAQCWGWELTIGIPPRGLSPMASISSANSPGAMPIAGGGSLGIAPKPGYRPA